MPTKRWVVWACAGWIAGAAAVMAQPHSGQATTAAKTTDSPADGEKNARESFVSVVSESRTALAKVRDYTCTFTRQELINGKISAEQVAEMKVRTNPIGVYVRFARPESVAGMEVAYSATRKADRMRYRPAGVAGAKGFQTLELNDPKFLTANRHPVTQWTMAAILDRVAAAVAREKTLNNPIEVYRSDYQFAGRNVVRYEVLLRRPHAFRTAYQMLVYIDKETKLPLRYEAYDQPKPGTHSGDLIESYSFSDVKLNVGLGENTFDY
ncbi:MAG: DUF1571 domain-containing protein [Gemmataceae bacterium]|nr:DUF1571 domain-containing protein [Gemmata sp.]MDW8196985.1 DUF1571 domain-containing protein [Gemmataceae bacterium]